MRCLLRNDKLFFCSRFGILTLYMRSYASIIILFVVLIASALWFTTRTSVIESGPTVLPRALPEVKSFSSINASSTASGLFYLSGHVPKEITWGDKTKKQVIFTFDAGAGSQSAAKILETLARHHVTGTFFMTGQWAKKNPDIAQEIIRQGHEIFNHTYRHPHLPQLSDEQIVQEFTKAEQAIKDATGALPKPYFRAPYGDRDSRVLRVAASQGYRSVYWTVDALDWKESEGYTAAQSKEKILRAIKPGAIYLMHVGDTITGKILDEVFTEIEQKGYQIVSLGIGIQ